MKTLRLSHILGAFRHVICVLVCLLCFSQPVLSGELADFEQDATKEEPEKKTVIIHKDDDDDDEEDGFWDTVLMLTIGGLYIGGKQSWDRVQVPQSELKFLQPRHLGEAVIPFFRFDGGYQNVAADMAAYDARAESGYGPFGVQVRYTHYQEDDPADELDLLQVHGLYRMSFGNHVECDLGIGFSSLQGEERHTGFSLTTPILVHPKEFFGIELRPSWSTIHANLLSDYDLGVVLSYRYAALRVGYRWMHSEHEALDGPYIGFSFRF